MRTLSIKLNETKEKMPSNKSDSQNDYSLEYQRGIKNFIKQLQKTLYRRYLNRF